MNYRIGKTSKSNLIHYHFIKNITHCAASITVLDFFKHLITGFKSLFNLIFAPTQYIYDDIPNNHRTYNDNYHYSDITDLQLRASTRTFL